MADAPPETAPPGFLRRFLARFVFVYLLIYNLPFPFDRLPGAGTIEPWYQAFWAWLVKRVGPLFFGTEITVEPNGSGDTTYNYIQVFLFLLIALAVALLWAWRGRRAVIPPRWDEALRTYVRFSLATTMISYGAYKVIPSQFPAPVWDRLLQPIGESSPMGLLWTFMGASVAYNIFAGASEVLGGVLLAFRRTMLLGALVTAAVMANVVALNFCYDVPVKLYSAHLLAMAIFLAAPDLRRLADLFWFHRAIPARQPVQPFFAKPWQRKAAVATGLLLIVWTIGHAGWQSVEGRRFYASTPSPLRGIWLVEEVTTNGTVRPPLVTDETRWRRLVIEFPDMLSIHPMTGRRVRYNLQLDADKKTLTLGKRDDSQWKATLVYRELEPGLLELDGDFGSEKVQAKLRRIEDPDFLLNSRGFHWINEYPFNR